jgi:hypothetical protein
MSQPIRVDFGCFLELELNGGGRGMGRIQPEHFFSPLIVFSLGKTTYISSSWVKIRLYTKNHLPGLPGSDLTV